MQSIYDFWVFNKEGFILACLLAFPTGVLFGAGDELVKFIIRRIGASRSKK